MADSLQSKEWTRISEETLNNDFPLHRACRDGDIALLSNLLLHKDSAAVHLNLEDTYYGWTPLHWACYFGKPDCLRVLVEANSIGQNFKTSRYNQTPTHIAAFAGYSKCLQILLQVGSDIDCKDYLGETPLHKAARSGSVDCVTLLIQNKADYRIRNNNGKTAAELSQICHQREVEDFLLSIPYKEPPCPVISSNGYYGYHPINESRNVPETDIEMDTDDIACPPHLSLHSNDKNDSKLTNGFTNGHSFTLGTNGFERTNIFSTNTNGINKDITISKEFSQNRVPVAGKKRSREEAFSAPVMKRLRTEGIDKFHSTYFHTLQRVPFHNISNWGINEQERSKVKSHEDNDYYCRNSINENVNLPSHLHQEQRSSFYASNLFMQVDCLKEFTSNIYGIDKEREDTSLSSELLRETHGCEFYLLLRESI